MQVLFCSLHIVNKLSLTSMVVYMFSFVYNVIFKLINRLSRRFYCLTFMFIFKKTFLQKASICYRKELERERQERLARERLAARRSKVGGKGALVAVPQSEDLVQLHDALLQQAENRHQEERGYFIQVCGSCKMIWNDNRKIEPHSC